MPCDSVATATARVAPEALAAVIESELGQALLRQHLKNLLGVETVVSLRDGNAYFRAGLYYGTLYRTGQVSVGGPLVKQAAQIAARLEADLPRLRGLVMQQKIKAALAQRYVITGEQYAGENLVLTLEV